MADKRIWAVYPEDYFARQVETLAGWIKAGESGSIVGLAGSGKSNLLGFVCHKPEVLQPYLPNEEFKLALVQVDLNDLLDHETATFYRLILRSLFEARAQLATLAPSLGPSIEEFYDKIEKISDAFLSQSVLRQALFLLQEKGIRLVLAMDPFDHFCQTTPVELLDNLRGLRDSFKSTLSYIVGVRHPLAYLRDPLEIGRIYQILDTHICWVGAMTVGDARWVITQIAELTGHPFAEAEIEQLIEVAGSYPSLLKAASLWLVRASPIPDHDRWVEALMAESSLQHRLEAIWNDLNQEEQAALFEIQKWQNRVSARVAAKKEADKSDERQALDKVLQRLAEPYQDILPQLETKGLCRQTGVDWRISSPLMAQFVASAEGRDSGKIWLDDESEILYHGQAPLEGLAPLERSVLSFLVRHSKVRHTKTDLIVNTWPDELRRQGVTDQSLYQVILELRKKIEPNWTKPRHLVTWRGKPEGGYQFFPEGRPG